MKISHLLIILFIKISHLLIILFIDNLINNEYQRLYRYNL